MSMTDETPSYEWIHSCKWCQQFQLDFGATQEFCSTATTRVKLPMTFVGSSSDDERYSELIQSINQFLTSAEAATCAFSQTILKALSDSHEDHQPVKSVFSWLGGVELLGNNSKRLNMVNYYWYKSTSMQFYLDPKTYRIPSNTLQDVKKWILGCDDSHEACKPLYKGGFFPRRLLRIRHIGEEWSACLVYPEASCEFTALSYCWGGIQDVLYTSETQVQWEADGIPWQLLPRMFQDAMLVTHVLGIEFIWIDALCILQDDNLDKESQIAQMPRIYNTAVVTLSALGMSSVHDALFETQRRPLQHATNIFGLSALNSQNECDRVVLVPSEELKVRVLKEDSLTEPLDRRAWTFQETLLSRRLLRFTSSSIRWQCKIRPERSFEEVQSELLLTCHPINPPIRRMQQLANFNYILESGQLHCPNGLKSEIPETDVNQPHIYPWHYIVEEYSKRTLSFLQDRPLAISGIAERIAIKTEDQYCAGLWRSHFVNQLAWYIGEDRNELHGQLPFVRFSRIISAESNLGLCAFEGGGAFTLPNGNENRPQQRQRLRQEAVDTISAPSWSWTSVPQPIKFRSSHVKFTLEILDVQVQLSIPQAPFGNVDHGTLTARGQIKHDPVCNCLGNSQKNVTVPNTCEEAICLKLGENEYAEVESSQRALCLQLRRKSSQTWARFGLSHTFDSNWLRAQTIVIE